MMTTKLTILALCLASSYAIADGAPTRFQLGTIDVKGEINHSLANDEVIINKTAIDQFNADNIADTLKSKPGVSLAVIGGRNELGLSVRGFDSRQVPIFLDGIPQYVPYDGYVDFGRFLVDDLSEIRLAKSGASLMYGANTLGGAINLVSSKPKDIFEGNVSAGFKDDGSKKIAVNLGSNNGTVYVHGGFAYLDSNKFRLAKHFTDGKKKPTDTGKYRENAYHTDSKYSLKLGLTPNDTDEYMLGYSAMRGEKGQPIYVGDATEEKARFWQWPNWDKDSIYFLSNTQLGEKNQLRIRLYHDTYKNSMQMFKDPAYSIKNGDLSVYKDKTLGASVNFVSTVIDNNSLQFGYQYKIDEHNDISKDQIYKDQLHMFAVEDQLRFADAWSARLGLAYETQETKKLPQKFKKGKTSSSNALFELSYQLNQQNLFYGLLSHKSRFPTIKDRYSYRMGRAIPNPDLKVERANHFSLGWKGQPWTGSKLNTELFYSRLSNEIQSNKVLSTECGKKYCNQANNIGRTRHYGFELTLDQEINNSWDLGLNYTYLNRKNLQDHSAAMFDTPQHKLFVYTEYRPLEQVSILAGINTEKGRISSYAGENSTHRQLATYLTMDVKIGWTPIKNLLLETGVKNITDRNYQFKDGYPMAGRTWFANTNYRF